MITIIEYHGNNCLSVSVLDSNTYFLCSTKDINKHHSGRWNSRVVAFVPDDRYWEDGSPVDELEEYWGYDDHSPIYYDKCQTCGVDTHGMKYCGTSCELYDKTCGGMECDA